MAGMLRTAANSDHASHLIEMALVGRFRTRKDENREDGCT
jgi:hypothetical protein